MKCNPRDGLDLVSHLIKNPEELHFIWFAATALFTKPPRTETEAALL